MPERDPRRLEEALAVGAAVAELGEHRADDVGLGRLLELDDAADAAHQRPQARRRFGRCASALKRSTSELAGAPPHLVERFAIGCELPQRSAEPSRLVDDADAVLLDERSHRRRLRDGHRQPGHQVLEQLVGQREPRVVGLRPVDHEPDVVGSERGDELLGRDRLLDAHSGQLGGAADHAHAHLDLGRRTRCLDDVLELPAGPGRRLVDRPHGRTGPGLDVHCLERRAVEDEDRLAREAEAGASALRRSAR